MIRTRYEVDGGTLNVDVHHKDDVITEVFAWWVPGHATRLCTSLRERGVRRPSLGFSFWDWELGSPAKEAVLTAWAIERSYVLAFGSHSFAAYPSVVSVDYQISVYKSLGRVWSMDWPLPWNAGGRRPLVGDRVRYTDPVTRSDGGYVVVAFDSPRGGLGLDLRGALLVTTGPRLNPVSDYLWAPARSLVIVETKS